MTLDENRLNTDDHLGTLVEPSCLTVMGSDADPSSGSSPNSAQLIPQVQVSVHLVHLELHSGAHNYST